MVICPGFLTIVMPASSKAASLVLFLENFKFAIKSTFWGVKRFARGLLVCLKTYKKVKKSDDLHGLELYCLL